jgi:hypothetical protein
MFFAEVDEVNLQFADGLVLTYTLTQSYFLEPSLTLFIRYQEFIQSKMFLFLHSNICQQVHSQLIKFHSLLPEAFHGE